MTDNDFTFIVEGPELQGADLTDALHEAKCDDALVGRTDGIQYLDFDREAGTPEEPILSAVANVDQLNGVRVVRIADAGLVSMVDTASRTSRTRESARLLVAGERGPGGFPPPVTDPRTRYRLWQWSKVERRLATHFGPQPSCPDDQVVAAINAGLEFRLHSEHLDADNRIDLRRPAGL